MAKALKVVAVVVGVAALAIVTGGAAAGLGISMAMTAFDVSASTLFLVSAGLSAAASMLTKGPTVPTSQTDRLTATIDPRAFRKTVLGQTAMATDVRYEEWSGKDQEYCDWIVALASHAIDGFEEIWLNDELAWTAAGGPMNAKFLGYFWVSNVILEGSPANAFTFGSGKWNGSARLTGCAYLRLRFKVTGNGKKGESPFASGIPSRMTIIGRGAKLYDPRRDSTVPGGSGSMRWNDQSTWRYTATDGAVIGENLPLQILRVLLGWRIRNPVTGAMKLATGSGIPAKRIDMQSFIVAANLADELVNRSAGGNEPRYHGAAVVSEGDDPKTVLDMLCAACCARLRDTGGRLSLVISHNDLANAATDDGLNDDDVIGGFTWNPDPSLEQTPNIIRGKYVDASTSSLYQLIDYPEVALPSPDGQDRIFALDLGAVESPSHAQRVAKQILQRKQYNREFSAPFDIRAWKYAVGDVVPFTFAPLGFVRVLFRVKEQELGQNGTCNMTLTYETALFYQWDADDRAPVQAAEAITYDSRNNPLILAIDEAGRSAEWPTVTDPTGTKPEDNATNGRDPDSPLGPDGETVGDALIKLKRIEPIATAVDLLGKATADLSAADRQRVRDQAELAEALLRLTSEAGRTREVLRDAGIVVDPNSGTVRIYAVDQLADRTSKTELAMDAVTASILQRATVDYVNEKILAAQLDPSQIAGLSDLIARVSTAETLIDGLNAAVQLRATLLELTGVKGRVTTTEQRLDAVTGAVSTKAEQTTVDALATSVGSVEQTLQSLGNVSGLAVTIRQARATGDAAAEASLGALLAGDKASQRQFTAVAEIRQELFTRIDDGLSAEAVARTLLSVKMGEFDVRMAEESLARITAQTALARQSDALSVALGQTNGAVAVVRQAQIDSDHATASSIQQITTRLDGVGGVGIEQSISATIDRLGHIEAQGSLVFDVNGNLFGYKIIGSDAGPAAFNLINTDLKMGTGRIVFNNGTFMEVKGISFGKNNDLLSWYGPTMAIDQCTRANGLEWKGTDGNLYTSGSIKAGPLVNSGSGTAIAADASFSIGPFGSNGGSKTVVASYSFRRVRTVVPGGGGAITGSPSASLVLEYQRPEGGWSTAPAIQTGAPIIIVTPATGQDPGRLEEAMSGSVTWTDARTFLEGYVYRLRLTSRTLSSFSGTATGADSVTQSLSILSQE